ncbi:MAG: TetR/AcrR family transcriptional regulator [Aggregatilineales bacterium]
MARKPADQSVSPEDIISAAADVLQHNGYEATTMKDIAARVNLTAASLYHHFKNKDALLLAVLERGLELAYEQISAVANHPELTAGEKLREMARWHILNVTKNTTVGAAMVFEIRSLMSIKTAEVSGNGGRSEDDFIMRRDAFFTLRDKFEALFRYTVREGTENGEFREVDAAIFAKMMLGAHNWVGVWYKDSGRLSGEEVADMIAENFLMALRK